MEDSFIEQVHLTISGFLVLGCEIPGVECAFTKGSYCLEKYKEVRAAYDRICQRLGAQNEDEDLEIIIDGMIEIEEQISYRMYRYGAKFGVREE